MSSFSSLFRNVTGNPTNIGSGGIVANLPALRTGGGAEGSSIDPTLRPYLGMGLQRAEQLFFGQQPQLYPGQMYVSPSEQTIDALRAQEQLARGPAAPLTAAQTAFLSGIQTPSAATPLYQNIYGAAATQPGADVFRSAAAGQMQNVAMPGFADVAGGSFLMGSPYRDMAIQSAVRPLMQQFEQTTLPGIQSAFSRAGRYGSGAQERAIGQATEATGRAIGDVASQISAADFARERGLQEQARAGLAGLSAQGIQTQLAGASGLSGLQQAQLAAQLSAAGGVGATQAADLQRQLAAAQMAPSIYAQQFLPSEQLAQIGASREAIEAKPLQEDISRFQFEQQLPYSQLQSYLSAVYGNPMGGSQVPQQAAAQSNRLGTALGGAALGAGAASFFGGGQGLFGFNPTQTALGGAALGGLLGGFF
jgi:hypothetical protein